MTRADKLKKLEEGKTQPSMTIITDSEKFMEAFEAKIEDFKKALAVGVEVDAFDLINELKNIQTFIPAIKELVDSIDGIEIPPIPEIPKSIEVKGLAEVTENYGKQIALLQRIAEIKMPDIDVKIQSIGDKQSDKITKKVDELLKKNVQNNLFSEKSIARVIEKLDNVINVINDNAPEEQSREVGNFTPVRRVRMIGNRLVFDDDAWTGGGSGGGTNLPIVNGVVPVGNKDGTPIAGGSGGGGDASAANQTSGNQKTQLVDSGGEAATVTGGKLDVNASIDTTGLATTAKQDTGNTSLADIDSKVATTSKQDIGNTSLGDIDTNLGAKADSAAGSDTASSSLIGLFKRALQSLTTIITNTGNIATNTNGVSTAAKQDTGNTSLSGIKTDVDTLTASGGGGYVRQDSNATIAKESGGNLAGIATNTAASSTATNQTNGNQQTKITNGTTVADTQANDTGYNGLSVNNATKVIPFSTVTTGAQQLLANTDVRGYSWAEVITTSIGTALAWQVQFAPITGGTYINSSGFQSSTSVTSTTGGIGTANNTIYGGQISGAFLQLNITAMTGGTTSGYILLHALPKAYQAIGATINTNSINTNGAITTSSTAITAAGMQNASSFIPVSIHGTYAGISFGITISDDNASTFYNVPIYDTNKMQWLPPGSTITPGTNVSNIYWVPSVPNSAGTQVKVLASAFTSGSGSIRIGGGTTTNPLNTNMSQIMDAGGNARGANVDAGNNLDTTLGTRLDQINDAVTAYPFGHSYVSGGITTATTTIVKSGAGVLHSIVILGGTAGSITVYDNTSAAGTLIFPAFTPGSVATPITIPLDLTFSSGCVVVTGAATVMQVLYR